MIGFKSYMVETDFSKKSDWTYLVSKDSKEYQVTVGFKTVAQEGYSITIDGKAVCSERRWDGKMPKEMEELMMGLKREQDRAEVRQLYAKFVKRISR